MAHSKSNFYERIKTLSSCGIVQRVGTDLALTELGKWVANSKMRTQNDRLAFADTWLCTNCTDERHIVVLAPLVETLQRTSSGIRMDAACPSCGRKNMYVPAPSGMDVDCFVTFFNEAIAELGQYAEVISKRIG